MTISIQKANFWKRFSAWLVDTVAVLFCAIGLFILACTIAQTDAKIAAYEVSVEPIRAAIEVEFNIDLDLSVEDYNALEEAEQAAYDETRLKATQELDKRVKADKAVHALYADLVSSLITSGIVALLASHLLLNFCLPLMLKNGQTLGKKVFALGVMRTNGMKVGGTALFIRQFIGLFAMETMAVLYMCTMIPVGLITALMVQALQVGVLIKTDTNSSIHDLLADTVVVELTSQQIFATEEERAQFIAQEATNDAESNDTQAQNPPSSPEA